MLQRIKESNVIAYKLLRNVIITRSVHDLIKM